MKRYSLVLLGLLMASSAWATEYSKVEVRASVNDEETTIQDTGLITKFFASGARQTQKVNLPAATFTALTWPASADAVVITFTSTNSPVGLKLKGVTGDTGISIDSTVPLVLGLSSDAANINLGILNEKASADSCRVYWV